MKKLPQNMHCLDYKRQRVFALRSIKKGELLECSPVIPIPAVEWASVSQTVLRYSCYPWGEDGKDAAIALGYGSLFNCPRQQPNACYVNHLKDLVIEFFAARDIEKGEEITVDRRKPAGQG